MREAQGASLWRWGIIQPGKNTVEGQFENCFLRKTKHLMNVLCEEVLVMLCVVGVGKDSRLEDQSLNHLNSTRRKF